MATFGWWPLLAGGLFWLVVALSPAVLPVAVYCLVVAVRGIGSCHPTALPPNMAAAAAAVAVAEKGDYWWPRRHHLCTGCCHHRSSHHHGTVLAREGLLGPLALR